MGNFAGYPSAVITGTPGKSGRIQGLGVVAPPPFSPLDISDIIFWLDPISAFITLNGQDVSLWADRSAESNDLIQVTGGLQPLYVTPGGAPPFVMFDGTSDFMATASFTGGNQIQANTIFLVAQQRSLLGASAIWVDGLGSTGRHQFLSNDTDYQMFAVGGSAIVGVSNLNKNILVMIFNSTSSKLLINGGTASTVTIGGDFWSGMTLGARFSGTVLANIDVYEMTAYTKTLNASETNLVGNFLANKHSLTWTDI